MGVKVCSEKVKKKTPEKQTRHVLVTGVDSSCRTWVASALANAGIEGIWEAETGEDHTGHNPDIVICGGEVAYRWRKQGIATLTVNPAGSFVLPEDTELLTHALRAYDTGRARPRIVGVTGWHGGVGTSSLAHSIAAVTSRRKHSDEDETVLVDLSGPGPHPCLHPKTQNTDFLSWADLDPDEPHYRSDFVSHLPLTSGVRLLTSSPRGTATAAEPHTRRVVRALAHHHPVIIDFGLWDDRAQSAFSEVAKLGDGLVFVGWGNEASAVHLASRLRTWPPPPELDLTVIARHRHPWPLIAEECAPQARILHLPMSLRGTRRLRSRLSVVTEPTSNVEHYERGRHA
ncbi:MAG: hypothetical protein CSA82_01280 [Actinobacteria bacterium]|nr:MAG: hypothetical protein CSA82_01280 [Actinomycetota bacterium]